MYKTATLEDILVDHMDNSIVCNDIGHDNFGTVDVVPIFFFTNGQFTSL